MAQHPPRAASKYTGSAEDRSQGLRSGLRQMVSIVSRRLVPGKLQPFTVLVLSLVPGLGSAVARQSAWPLLYESLPLLAVLAWVTWSSDIFFTMFLFSAMGTLAAFNYQRACAQAGIAALNFRHRIGSGLAYAVMYLVAISFWGQMVASRLVRVQQDFGEMATMGDRLIFWGDDYRRGDLVRTETWIEVVAGLPGETVTWEGGRLKINGIETALSEMGALRQLPSFALAKGDWGRVPADTYLCIYPYGGEMVAVRLSKSRLLGRAIWHYRPGVGMIP